MESRVRASCFRDGFALVTVLIITAVGLLLGAGALLMFRYQCQMRIDRQHELEKVYAVRSVLNYIRSNAGKITDAGMGFGYHSRSERDLNLLVKPVAAIFPIVNKVVRKHFVMENGHFGQNLREKDETGGYSETYDYEYGTSGTTNFVMSRSNEDNDGRFGLAFRDVTATNGAKWWVNIGMRDTGGWLQEDYGRRYYFLPMNYVGGTASKDVIRLCIIRNITNENNTVGCRHGWPLSKERERALVFEVRPNSGDTSKENNAVITLSEYEYRGGAIIPTLLRQWNNCNALHYTGIQLAGDKMSVFQIESAGSGYTFLDSNESTEELDCCELTEGTRDYFANEQWIGGMRYAGTNVVDGKLQAPELRAVFEVEALSNTRPQEMPADYKLQQLNFLTFFKVTPAYQFDVFLEHPAFVTNLATVAQRIVRAGSSGAARDVQYTTLTYDTHGTENRGFRKDERAASRRHREERVK